MNLELLPMIPLEKEQLSVDVIYCFIKNWFLVREIHTGHSTKLMMLHKTIICRGVSLGVKCQLHIMSGH